MGRRIWVLTSGILGIAACLYPATSRMTASAYPVNVNNCSDDSVTWRFSDEFANWTSTKKNWAEAAINTLDGARDYDGVKLMTVTHDQGAGSAVDVQIKNAPLNDLYGSSECAGTPSIWVNNNATTGSRFYWKVTRHEMFHIMGAEHGGRYDSFDGNEPTTMSTCLDEDTFAWSNVFEQDGHAYENWLWSDLPERQLHANIGFEQGSRFWGFSGGGFVEEHSTGGATGPGYIGWVSPGPSAYVYQTVRTEVGNLSNDVVYRGVANAETGSGNWDTQIRVELWRRAVNWSGDNSCSYRNGIQDPNGSPVTSGWVLVAETSMATVGGSWTLRATPWESIVGADGYDFQVRVHGTAIDGSGDHHQVHLDNIRGEGPS